LTESTASQLASNNELAASQLIASTNNELDDPVVVARRNHPNWIAK
jgi:PHD/YefM family antitoxin component YafN of YafNO toxin-antitoxin module